MLTYSAAKGVKMQTLKEVRESKGIKLTAVANHLGISRQTYRLYERDPSRMSISQAVSACEFIGVSPSKIFFELEGK